MPKKAAKKVKAKGGAKKAVGKAKTNPVLAPGVPRFGCVQNVPPLFQDGAAAQGAGCSRRRTSAAAAAERQRHGRSVGELRVARRVTSSFVQRAGGLVPRQPQPPPQQPLLASRRRPAAPRQDL